MLNVIPKTLIKWVLLQKFPGVFIAYQQKRRLNLFTKAQTLSCAVTRLATSIQWRIDRGEEDGRPRRSPNRGRKKTKFEVNIA